MMTDTNANANKEDVVLYETMGGIATVMMNRPAYRNAQNSRMTYALDAAFKRAVDDDAIKVIILKGAGKHFSAGHDLGNSGPGCASQPRSSDDVV